MNLIVSIYRVDGGRKEDKKCFLDKSGDAKNIMMSQEDFNVFCQVISSFIFKIIC